MNATGPELPMACSLDAADLAERGERWRALGDRALAGERREGERRVLRFRAAPGVEEELRELVAAERECCPFLALEVGAAGEEVELSVSGPEGSAPTVDALAAAVGA